VPVRTVPIAHADSCTMGTMSFPGVKRTRGGADRPLLSTVEVANGLELYLRLTSVPAETCHRVIFLPKLFMDMKYVMFFHACGKFFEILFVTSIEENKYLNFHLIL